MLGPRCATAPGRATPPPAEQSAQGLYSVPLVLRWLGSMPFFPTTVSGDNFLGMNLSKGKSTGAYDFNAEPEWDVCNPACH